jgi:hypothetical protein
VINDECQGDKNEDKKKHVCARIALHCEVDVELTCENKEDNNEREDRAWPDEYKNTKNDEHAMP